MDPKWQFLHVFWQHREKLLVLVLIASLIAPQPARAQFGIDWGAIVAAINSIGTAISNTIGPALRAINGALGTLNNLMSSIQAFFTNIVYPQAAINRARGLVSASQTAALGFAKLVRPGIPACTDSTSCHSAPTILRSRRLDSHQESAPALK